jgi:prepilin-type N-terminal cleavage/methylation domain-containing protein
MSVSTRSRAFTLIEVMVVVAIAGLLAFLAVPSFQEMAVHYRSQEDARAVLMAMTKARALAQRENVPVRLVTTANTAIFQIAQFGALTPEQIAASVRRNVTGWTNRDQSALPKTATVTSLEYIENGAVTSTQAPGANATLVFCPSSDSYFRDATTGNSVCRVGDLTSDSARIQFQVLGKAFHIRVNGALGTVDLRRGTL